MKKIVSLTVLTALVAGCMDLNSDKNTASYGQEGISEEQLAPAADSNLNTNAYLMAAAPKYYIGSPYKIEDVQYVPAEDLTYNQTGIAGIVPVELNGSKTSDGEIFNSNQLVATSKTLPLPSIVKVTNLENGNSVVVRVNNRGPFVNTRIMDLSSAAAQQIGMNGTAKVQIQVLPAESTTVKEATLGETAKTEPAPATAVTETVAVETAPVEKAPVATSGDYSVQVAAVYSEDNANALAKELAPYGNAVVVHEADMYKVRIINLDAANARRVIDALRSDKGMAPGLLKAGKWVNADSI
ncbi:MAG: septal ring lytic transglycosylase RlpA family protein [Alphaproteobacteria bacterium]|nr:septal ring lytic transglycosylase RlpA family protein [Alphaproteobacteria bacterium]